MNMNDYQAMAKETAVFPKDVAFEYLCLGLVGEAGEVANKAKKIIRGDYDDDIDPDKMYDLHRDIAKELGDVLWYVAVLADHIGHDLKQIAGANLMKLANRRDANTLKGTGDDR